jgi:hypothetical protein
MIISGKSPGEEGGSIMTVTTTQEPEAPEVAALGDDTRREIVELREGGLTLGELKVRFPQLSGEQIREVLPPGNARERKAREAKQPKAIPQAEEPKVEEPRYATDLGDLPERVLAARDVVGGRGRLAELLGGISGSAVWRHERGRTHPTEVDALREALAAVEKRIAAGEFVKPEPTSKGAGPGKADLAQRIEVAAELCRSGRGDRAITKAKLADALLAVLDPQA